MHASARQQIESTFQASQQGRLHFGQLIGELVGAGVESYQVDYRAGRISCYLPNGDTLDIGFEQQSAIPDEFDADAVRAVIRGAQQGQVMYPEFKQLSQQAGCAGYTVWITGRHVTYHGRRGQTHVERFPD